MYLLSKWQVFAFPFNRIFFSYHIWLERQQSWGRVLWWFLSFFFNMTFLIISIKMKASNHYMLYHSPWQPSGKAPVRYVSESLHTLPPAIIPKPGLCSWAPYMMHGKRWLRLKRSCPNFAGKKQKGKGLKEPRTDLCREITWCWGCRYKIFPLGIHHQISQCCISPPHSWEREGAQGQW